MNSLVKIYEGLVKSLGIDPFLPLILFMLLTCINEIKDIKVWDKINTNQKIWDISSWVGLGIMIIIYIVKLIR